MFSKSIGLIALLATLSVAYAQFGGSLTSNSRGGADAFLRLGHQFGDANRNFGGGVFASGNTLGGPVTRGGFLSANSNGLGASLQHSKTPGFGSVFSQNARANIFQNDKHNLDANAFHSRTKLDNGFKFNTVGGGLDYNHANGHGASLTASRIPQLNMNTVDLTGKANLWKSQDRATTLDLTGGVSKNFGGPLDGQTNKHVGVGLSHNF
ncbi:attacin-A-like [Stomoxys calcitrans]|uniref:attacin-A-like n=1 Tax=Stomoxys calcitrans TaxID=35570 RepID=UPI0027E3AD78|nr:attacin-A-like [Stomoxys calcitrans]